VKGGLKENEQERQKEDKKTKEYKLKKKEEA
jgi:hypothetical protein